MKLILKHLKNYKALLLLNVISVFGFALVELGIPTVIAVMIDKGVVTGDKGYLFRMGGIIAIISVLGAGGTILLGYCCARISTLVTRDIRLEAFKKVQNMDLEWIVSLAQETEVHDFLKRHDLGMDFLKKNAILNLL